MKFYPLKLDSVLKKTLWGGKRLSTEYSKGQDGESYAEAWTLTVHPDGVNTILNGKYKGMSLDKYIELAGKENVCKGGFDKFPILVKFIDACDTLSVQVHPDDNYALEKELDAGKTEMWYILDALPGAKLICGLNKDIQFNAKDFKRAAECGDLEKYLNYTEVKKGDVVFIPAGLVHAIGAGILIAEIQQNSNTTYRIYDYNRVGADGKKRELHVERAIEAIKPELSGEVINLSETGEVLQKLVECDYFTTSRLALSGCQEYTFKKGEMIHLICIEGKAEIIYDGECYELSKGDAYIIPCVISSFSVRTSCGVEIICAEI